MKIDWKYVATTDGYKSLKAAYIESVQALHLQGRKYSRHSDFTERQEELYKKFKLIISRATHFAEWENTSIDVIINSWEAKRLSAEYVSSIDSFYYEYGILSKYTTSVLRPIGVTGIRKRRKNNKWYSAIAVKKVVLNKIMYEQKNSSTKAPKRWTAEYKRKAYIRRR